MTIQETIIKSLRNAAIYNKSELAPPVVILWPDEERLWEQCIGQLRDGLPALWTLGEYDSKQATGPAVWLRYQLEQYSGTDVPIIYLPGIARSAFRSAQECPDPVQHLFALQFQGQFWTHKNGRDWTPYGFLTTKDDGLGMDVASDQDTKGALQECLPKLLAVSINDLQGHKLEASDFRALITPDPVRQLLKWMCNPIKVKEELEKSGSEWSTFCAICRDTYNFDPEKEGVITAGERLSSSSAAWMQVWERFKDTPETYQGIRSLLLSQATASLFAALSEYRPQANLDEEARLEKDLLALSSVSEKDALKKIKALASEHADRADWVWARLGDSPLAQAIRHLRELAETIEKSGNPSTIEALADYYTTIGWRADCSVLLALDKARTPAATKAVTAAIRAVYIPWLEKFAILIQGVSGTYPNICSSSCRTLAVEDGTVYLFADGLRMDIARMLEEQLTSAGFAVDFTYEWSALPTVTATSKPAWMPLAEKLGGPLTGVGFEANEIASEKPLTHARFKQLLGEVGIPYLVEDTNLFPTGSAWTESGDIDKYGHDQGAKLAWRVTEEVDSLLQRVKELIGAGWSKVRIITDHGWLMVPGGLPKIELPKHLTEARWGRCAIPSPGTHHGLKQTSWFWDAAEAVVLAPDIRCFKAGMEYAHGGLTLQEALIPSMTVTTKGGGKLSIQVKEISWSGMRLKVVLAGAAGCDIDLRQSIGDAATSVIASPVTGAGDGERTSLLVADDDLLGTEAFLVVLSEDGQVVYKHPVVIGEE